MIGLLSSSITNLQQTKYLTPCGYDVLFIKKKQD